MEVFSLTIMIGEDFVIVPKTLNLKYCNIEQVKLFSCKAKVVDVVLSNGLHFISCTSSRLKMVKSGSKLMCETCGAIQAVGKFR